VRIAQFGTFDVRNYGDLVFPLVLRHRLRDLATSFVHASPAGGPPVWGDAVPSVRAAEVIADPRGVDGIVIGGGHLLHASPDTVYDPASLHAALAYPALWFGAATLAARAEVPLAWNAPGAPRPLEPVAARLLAWSAGVSDYVSVRDRGSRRLLEEAGVTAAVHVVPDPALDVARLWTADEVAQAHADAFAARGRPVPERTLAVHLNARYLDEGDDVVAARLDRLARQADATAVLLAIGPCHGDDALARRVAAHMAGAPLVVDQPRSLREVAALIGRAEAYVGSSLHGMVTACAFARPGLLVAGETATGFAKFRGFLEQFGLEGWQVGSWAQAEERGADLLTCPRDPWRRVGAVAAPLLDEHWARIRAALTGPAVGRAAALEDLRGLAPGPGDAHGLQALLAETLGRRTTALAAARARARELEGRLTAERAGADAARASAQQALDARAAAERERQEAVRAGAAAQRDLEEARERRAAAEREREEAVRGRAAADAELERARRELARATAAAQEAAARERRALELVAFARRQLTVVAGSRTWRVARAAARAAGRARGGTPGPGPVHRALATLPRDPAALDGQGAARPQPPEPPVVLRQVTGAGSARSGRTRVAVLSWDMGHNPLGRAHLLADVLADSYDVEVVGAQFPRYGTAVWQPLRSDALPMRTFPGRDFPAHFADLNDVAAQLDADVVYVSKPRLPSFELGMLAKQLRNRPLLLDVDDHELAFFPDGRRLALDEVAARAGDPDHRLPFGRLWTGVADGLIASADALTVSNEALRARYGGTVIPHARDERLFDPARYDRDEQRARLGFAPGDRVILFAGTPRQHKGLVEIAEALDRIGNPDFRLAVLGTAEYAALRSALAAYERWITVLPYQPFAQLPATLSAADLVCVLQRPDSGIGRYQIPAKVTDALAMGVPCLTTRVAPLAGLIERGALEVLDDTPLAPRIEELLTDGERARARALANRSVFLETASYAAVRPALAGIVERLLADVPPQPPAFTELLDHHRAVFPPPAPVPAAAPASTPAPASAPAPARPARPAPPVRRRVGEARVRPAPRADGYDIVMFWKQNDTGLYGRRQDMFVKYLARDPRVARIVHFDAPVPVRDLVRSARFGPDARLDHSNLVLRQTVSRVAGVKRAPRTTFHTFVHGGGPTTQRLLGDSRSYPGYVAATLGRAGVGTRPLVFWTYPRDFRFPDLADLFDPDLVVADVVDDHRTFVDAASPMLARLNDNYRQVLARSDVVLANCEPVRAAMREFAPEVHLVPNACEYPPPPDDGRVPPDLARLRGPIIGYVGNLSSRIDIGLLDHVARARPGWQIVLIGSAHLSRDVLVLDRHPNVHFLGVRPYAEVQRYVRAFDVGIVPHLDDAMTRSMNPLKAYLFCSLGIPVVSTPIANLDDLAGLLTVAGTPDGFVAAVEAALTAPRPPDAARERLRAHSWETRVSGVLDLVDRALERA